MAIQNFQRYKTGVFDPFKKCNCTDNTMKNNPLNGVIVMQHNGYLYPVDRVNIANLTQKNKGTSTDDKGRYSLVANPADEIQFSHISLKTKRMLFRDIPNVLVMDENVQELNEVVVTPKKVEVTPSNNSKIKKAGNWLFWGVLLSGVLFFTKDKKDK